MIEQITLIKKSAKSNVRQKQAQARKAKRCKVRVDKIVRLVMVGSQGLVIVGCHGSKGSD